jgi:hypothetical protein
MDGIQWNPLSANNILRQSGPVPQPTIPVTPPIQLPILSVVYVDGRQGAVDYPTPANCPGIPLFDKNSNIMYVKVTDNYGNLANLLEFDMIPRKSQIDKQNEAMTNINARLDRLEEMITNAMATKSNNGGVGESTAATTADGDPKPKRR